MKKGQTLRPDPPSPCNTESYTPTDSVSSGGGRPQDFPTRLDSIGTSQQKCCGGWLYNRDCKVIVRLSCKRWDCPACVKRKGKKICRRIHQSGCQERLNRLITLPFALGERTWREAIMQSGAVLNRFLVGLKRCVPRFRYFWVREIGKKSSMVHFHCLIDRFIPKKLLQRLWLAAGGGYIVDVSLVRTSSRYVFKYLTKCADYAPAVQRALSRKRRYSCSKGVLAPLVRDKLIGRFLYLSVDTGLSLVIELGWRTEDGTVFSPDQSGHSGP